MNQGQFTRESILDAAERLFAEQGAGATSLRAITAAARVNLAAVHYHFGGKAELLAAVVARRLEPINRERLRRLERLEAGAGAPTIESLLDAFLAPALRSVEALGERGRLISRLLARVSIDEPEDLQAVVIEQLREVALRFAAALVRALPEVPSEEIYVRVQYAAAVLIHVLADAPRLDWLPPATLGAVGAAATLDRLIAFLAAGFCAPPPAAAREVRREA